MTPPSETKGYGHADAVQTYQIRPATMEDSPAIRQIRNAAVRESLAIWTSIEQDPARAETWLAHGAARNGSRCSRQWQAA